MVVFEDIQDVEEWLAPPGYIAFWAAMDDWAVFTEDDRDQCDRTIADAKYLHNVH